MTTPYYDQHGATLYVGDVVDVLKTLPDGCVQTCVTSPPYWALRSYLPDDHADKSLEIGSEPTPDAFVAKMVEVFREVRRVLRDDGTLWLNLGDSYATGGAQTTGYNEPGLDQDGRRMQWRTADESRA
jgi:DNA modification methylase